MKNRFVGFVLIGVAVLIGFIIFSFNSAMTIIVGTSCSHGPSCPMWGTIDFQTNVSIAIMVLVIAVGLYLVFFGAEERIITRFISRPAKQVELKKITKEEYKSVLENLDSEEKDIFERIIAAQGSMLQSDLVGDETGMNKVKVTRVLDRLEVRGLIERRRRGMTNMVVLKR